MRLIFLRHGESEYNRLGLCNSDPAVAVALTPTGVAQAQSAARQLAGVPIRRVFVSRLQRARETASIVNARHGARVCIDARLDDRRTGFEGREVERFLQAQEGAVAPFAWRPPGGESYLDLVARVQGFLADMRQHGDPAVLVVTHHQVMQAAAGLFRGLTPEEMWQIPVANGGTFEFDMEHAC